MFLVSVCSKAAATQTGSTRHLRTPVVHSPSVRIQHLLRFRWTRIVVANILFPTLNLFQLWRNEISDLEEGPSLSTSAFGE